MNRKEKVYLYMQQQSYTPLTFDELKLVLDVPEKDISEFSGILTELMAEGKIFISKKGRYASCSKNNMVSGKLRCNPRLKCGFVSSENCDDVYIAPGNLAGAVDSDTVLVRLSSGKNNKKEGKILTVLSRGRTQLSAVLQDDFHAIADNPAIFNKITLTDTQNARPGDRILAEITDYASDGTIIAAVVSVLGSSLELKSLADAIIYEHEIHTDFPPDVISETESIPEDVPADALAGRTDFTNRIVFTVDGEDARDFDDAVSLEILSSGNYELGVHIADVTHYVSIGSAIDREASARGTSVYLADRVIPMLPKKLSNGLCSLNPGVIRLTLSVIMEIDPCGNIKNNKILKSYIRSNARMTYTDAAKILSGDEDMCKQYSHIAPTLQAMGKLSNILSKRRTVRGSINFDFPETKVMLNSDGIPEKVEKLVRNDAHHMIEEFMLAANETVAEFAFWSDLPFVYRIHEQPDGEKMDNLRKFIGNFGLYIKGSDVHPKTLQQILDKVKGTENELIISTYMLRSLMKAEYNSECMGHFGLASKYYCHFTSPIRRYPDLTIHRILKDFLSGKDISAYFGKVPEISSHSSETERTAEICERDIDDLFKTAYMQEFIGAEFPARISSVTNFGMFAELENGIEGLIRLENISGDYYIFDEAQRTLTGRKHGKVYKIGDCIKIEVSHTNLMSRQIDFLLAGNSARHSHLANRRRNKSFAKTHRKHNKRGKHNG